MTQDPQRLHETVANIDIAARNLSETAQKWGQRPKIDSQKEQESVLRGEALMDAQALLEQKLWRCLMMSELSCKHACWPPSVL